MSIKLVVRNLRGPQQFEILEYFNKNSKEIGEDTRELTKGVVIRGSRASVKEALEVTQEFWTFLEIARDVGIISWFVSKLLDLLKKYAQAKLELDDEEVPLTREEIEKIIKEKLEEKNSEDEDDKGNENP